MGVADKTLNGRKMRKGDTVYDILKGAGQVVNDGGGVLNVTVDFGVKGGRMSFAQDGTFQGARRLYWKPPYIVEPRGPVDEPYEKAVALFRVIYEHFLGYETRNQAD